MSKRKVNQNPIERIYPNDKRVKHQTIAHHKARYQMVLELVTSGSRKNVLDLGCGTGYGADIMRKKFSQVVGYDVSSRAIEYAKAHYPDCEFHCADISWLDFGSKTYDIVTMFEVIEHLKYIDGVQLISDIYEALNDEGSFILSTPRDINEENNGFHRSEWSYGDLFNCFWSVFDYVRIYGQDWDTAKISDKNVRENDFYIVVAQKHEQSI